MKYQSLNYFIKKVKEPNHTKLLDLYTIIQKDLSEAPGSSHNHQNRTGGYIEHILEILNIAKLLFATVSDKRTLQFQLEDVYLVLMLHDIEKPFKYVEKDKRSGISSDQIRTKIIKEYGFHLDQAHINALTYVHGEGKDYTNKKRVSLPLASFCHICDVMSARIFFDYPRDHELSR